MNELTVVELAIEDFKEWTKNLPNLTFEQARGIEPIFIEAWIRGFAYRMANGANNVRS